jgi:membrane-associated phospholipid phosphatase
MGSPLTLTLALALAVAAPIAAVAGDHGVPSGGDASPADGGAFLGPEYRWAEMPVVKRVLHDVVAIPANVPRWSAGDFATFGLWGGAVAALAVPLSPSVDVRIDRWSRDHVSKTGPVMWTGPMQGALWSSLAVGTLGTWAWAAATDHREIAQGMSLMGESLAVFQVYHVSSKLLLGRDGPMDGDRQGEFRGPANAFRVYPAGMPSGHAGTIYSLASAGLAYFDPPLWGHLLVHTLAAGIVAGHVIDHRHFASESLAGAVMGWYTGQWVVRHRASRLDQPGPSLGKAPGPQLVIAPLVQGGATGVALGVTY